MKTPTERSPLFLIQEEHRNNPWRMLVCCICLNQTSIKQVRSVIDIFFASFPDAFSCARASPEQIASIIRPLGIYNRRAKTLRAMSEAWSSGVWAGDPKNLPGIGRYALDSWKIFVDGEIPEGPVEEAVLDKELRNFVKWVRGRL